MHLSTRTLIAAALVGTMAAATPAVASTIQFTATLSGAKEVPPTSSKGTGDLSATYDTGSKVLTWSVTYSGLSGPAQAAHFHGPAAAGKNAGIQVPVKGSLTSPIKGSATLTTKQANQLEAGQWYFNIHTKKDPNGEIRGQVTKGK